MGFKIYTKSGDDGSTGLIGGERVLKDDIRVDSYGTVDELNSHVGIIRALVKNKNQETAIAHIQNKLFTIGSSLAQSENNKMILPEIELSDIQLLEQNIDLMTSELPELKNFILPGGSVAGAHAHVARTVCRRAERRIITLSKHIAIDPIIIQYINRLSDYFFTLARYLDKEHGGVEIEWKK